MFSKKNPIVAVVATPPGVQVKGFHLGMARKLEDDDSVLLLQNSLTLRGNF